MNNEGYLRGLAQELLQWIESEGLDPVVAAVDVWLADEYKKPLREKAFRLTVAPLAVILFQILSLWDTHPGRTALRKVLKEMHEKDRVFFRGKSLQKKNSLELAVVDILVDLFGRWMRHGVEHQCVGEGKSDLQACVLSESLSILCFRPDLQLSVLNKCLETFPEQLDSCWCESSSLLGISARCWELPAFQQMFERSKVTVDLRPVLKTAIWEGSFEVTCYLLECCKHVEPEMVLSSIDALYHVDGHHAGRCDKVIAVAKQCVAARNPASAGSGLPIDFFRLAATPGLVRDSQLYLDVLGAGSLEGANKVDLVQYLWDNSILPRCECMRSAVREGNLEIVQSLHQMGFSADGHACFIAASRADDCMLKLLLSRANMKECVNYRDPVSGSSFLHAVCQAEGGNKVGSVEVLLKTAPHAMAKLHVPDGKGKLPLAYASGEVREILGEYASAESNWNRVSTFARSVFVSLHRPFAVGDFVRSTIFCQPNR